MATPPFTGDTSNPADNGIVSQFPTNERTHRDEIISYLDTEHDANTGYHKFQLLSTTAKNALTTPPAGMLVYDTTLSKAQINTGTSGAPVWSDVLPSSVPTGTMFDFAGTVAPSGYLVCDGSAVSRTGQAALFAVLGTTWGAGDGSTTFNLPNLSRRSTIGSGGTGTSEVGNAVGNTGGEEAHTLTTGELPHQTYTVTDPGHSHQPASGGSFWSSQSGGTGFQASTASGNIPQSNTTTNTTGISVADGNGGGAHNVYHPVAVVLKIIKT